MNRDQEESVTQLVVSVSSQVHSVAELTALLGLVPDESWERGEPFGIGRRAREASSWVVAERAAGDEESFDAAERLVRRLEALVPRFQALPPGVEVSLRVLVDETNTVFGLGLDRSHVKFAAAIGADMDVSARVHMSIVDLERELAIATQMLREPSSKDEPSG